MCVSLSRLLKHLEDSVAGVNLHAHLLHLAGLLRAQGLQLLGRGLQLPLAAHQLPPQVALPLLGAGRRSQAIVLQPRSDLVQLRPHLDIHPHPEELEKGRYRDLRLIWLIAGFSSLFFFVSIPP